MPLSKTLQDLFSRVRRGRPSSGQAREKDFVEVFYHCDECFGMIMEGTKRYNCVECEGSYDLCSKCYKNGVAKAHTRDLGPLHTFVTERMSAFEIASLVHAKTLEGTIRNMFHYYAGRPSLGQYNAAKNTYEYMTYADLEGQVEQFACGLRNVLGHSSSPPMVAMCAISRLEWYVADFACLYLGIPTVPLTVTMDRENMCFVMNQSEVTAVVCSHAVAETMASLTTECTTLKTLVVMETPDGKESDVPVPPGVKVLGFKEVATLGKENTTDLMKIKPNPDGIFTLAFTSGSTGRPKGCVFSRQAWNSRISQSYGVGVKKIWLSFHPPAHNFERRNVHVTLTSGGKIGLYRGSMEHLMDDFALVRPTIVASTPRFWTMIYNQYLHALYEAYTAHLATPEKEIDEDHKGDVQDNDGGERDEGTAVGKSGEKDGEDEQGTDLCAESEARRECEREEDHRPDLSCIGAEHSSHKAAASSDEVTDVKTEGDQITDADGDESGDLKRGSEEENDRTPSDIHPPSLELTPEDEPSFPSILPPTLSSFNPSVVPLEIRQGVLRRFKSVLGGREQLISTGGAPTGQAVKTFMIECFKGIPQEGYGATEVGGISSNGTTLIHTDIKLIDVPEMGYFTTSDPPRGEICVKTPTMISGYYKNPEETSEKFVDGYFRTGDIGEMSGEKKLQIIDRKKNIFKLAQGEFVAPERLEAVYINSSPLIGQMYIYGNSLQSNVVCVVVPHEEGLRRRWERETHGDTTPAGSLTSFMNCMKGKSSIVRLNLALPSPSLDELCQQDKVRELYLRELGSVAQSNDLQGWEVPVGVLLEPRPFTMENNLLTNTFKQCRPQLERRYREELEVLYQKINANQMQQPLEIQIVAYFRNLLRPIDPAHPPPTTSFPDNFLSVTFGQLGGDSLAAMHLSALIREHLHTEISAEVILKQPLGKVLEMTGGPEFEPPCVTMATREGREIGSLEEDIRWESEISLDGLGLSASTASFHGREDVTVFLTGATGFLGRFLLLELLQNKQCSKVYCLVKTREDIPVVKRVHNLLRQLYSELSLPDQEEWAQRVVVLSGDLGLPRLGLSGEEWSLLCESVDVVIHNGAVVNAAQPYAALKAVNVGSTKEILKMVCSGRPKFLHYVSTIGVFAPLTPWEHIDESTPPSQDRLHRLSGYAQSKWVSEQLVLAAIRKGLLTGNMSRPGLIGPHTITGHANVQDWVCWLVRGLAKMGSYPVGSGCDGKEIRWVPVDQVARAVVHLSLQNQDVLPANSSCISHLVNTSSPVTFTEVAETMKNLLLPNLTTCEYADFRAMLARQAPTDRVLGSLDLLLPRLGGWPHSHLHSCGQTMEILEPLGVHVGALTEGYVEKYLSFLKSKEIF